MRYLRDSAGVILFYIIVKKLCASIREIEDPKCLNDAILSAVIQKIGCLSKTQEENQALTKNNVSEGYSRHRSCH